VRRFRCDRQEFAGALGDAGTLLPIAIALVIQNGMNPTAIFLFTGLAYLGVGVYYRLPIPVQPLKAVAATVLAMGASPSLLVAAGIWMGALELLLAWTGMADRLSRVFTLPVVRGIQVAIGLFMVKSGWHMVAGSQFLPGGSGLAAGMPGRGVPTGILVAVPAAFLLLGLMTNRRLPASLVLLGAGVVLGGIVGGPAQLRAALHGPSWPAPALPTAGELVTALPLLVLPQLPLTLGNAVVCTAATARDYFGGAANRVTPRALCASQGLVNLLGSMFGALPVCHGAGGLTAHVRFGARTGGAPILLGLVFLGVALVPGASALVFLIPPAVLGVLLMYIGIEHALLMNDLLGNREGLFTCLSVGAAAVATGRIDVAFLLGIAVAWWLPRSGAFQEPPFKPGPSCPGEGLCAHLVGTPGS